MRVVRNEVAPPYFQRIHADPGGGELDQSLSHRSRNGVADGTVLAHDILVLEHHARAGAIVWAGIRTAGEIDDLIGFDAGGARIDRIGADAGEVIDLPGGDGAVIP